MSSSAPRPIRATPPPATPGAARASRARSPMRRPATTAMPARRRIRVIGAPASGAIRSAARRRTSATRPGRVIRAPAGARTRRSPTARPGTAVAGVRVSLLGHGEYGWTRTRSDGMFDLVVNGGGLFTVRYAKAGFLTADRQVTVPWEAYAVLPAVVLSAHDPAVTTVDLAA